MVILTDNLPFVGLNLLLSLNFLFWSEIRIFWVFGVIVVWGVSLPQREAGEDHLGAVADWEGGFDEVGEGLLVLCAVPGVEVLHGAGGEDAVDEHHVGVGPGPLGCQQVAGHRQHDWVSGREFHFYYFFQFFGGDGPDGRA